MTIILASVLVLLCFLDSFAFAGDTALAGSPYDRDVTIDPDGHAHHSHTDPLHFLHPLVTESPLPENEVRLEFNYASLTDGAGDEFSLIGTLELAPVRWFSIEVSAPFTHLAPDAGGSETRISDVSIGFKFATFMFEDRGLLLAAGIELGLPTGNEERGIGSDHVLEVEPWFGFGYKRERFEWVARLGVGFPTNQNGDREADAELEWATSVLYHIVDHKLAALVEIDGLDIFGEQEDGFHSVSITPGVHVFPLDNPDVSIGVGVRFPLTSDRDSHVQTIFTVYFHF